MPTRLNCNDPDCEYVVALQLEEEAHDKTKVELGTANARIAELEGTVAEARSYLNSALKELDRV